MRTSLVAAVCLGTLGGQAPRLDSETFLRRAREALQLDVSVQSRFSYIEERRDVKVTKLGKVIVGPLRRFEVYPSQEPGQTYKRLIAVDGVPLSSAELAKHDDERQRDLRTRNGDSRGRSARRVAEEADAQRHRDAMLSDAVAVFEPVPIGEDRIEGERTRVFALTPRAGARVTTREGSWMKHFEGRAWFSEENQQLVKLDVQARNDVVIGWGIVGRVHQGSRVSVLRRRFEDAWLPAETRIEASGRTLLFRPFEVSLVTTSWGYRRR